MVDKVTKELPDPQPPTPAPRILWKAVEPRHYARAQERKKAGKMAYTDYVISLVERFDAQLVGVPGLYGELPIGAIQLDKAQVGQVLAAFEERFGPKDAGQK